MYVVAYGLSETAEQGPIQPFLKMGVPNQGQRGFQLHVLIQMH